MLKRNGNDISARYLGKKAITMVYRGTHLVWQLVSSCFGAGYWRNDFPWKDTDPWKNIG